MTLTVPQHCLQHLTRATRRLGPVGWVVEGSGFLCVWGFVFVFFVFFVFVVFVVFVFVFDATTDGSAAGGAVAACADGAAGAASAAGCAVLLLLLLLLLLFLLLMMLIKIGLAALEGCAVLASVLCTSGEGRDRGRQPTFCRFAEARRQDVKLFLGLLRVRKRILHSCQCTWPLVPFVQEVFFL